MDSHIDGVSDEVLVDIIQELRELEIHYSWSDEELAEEYHTVQNHLREQRIVNCDSCDEEKEYVDEPMISGVTGYFCTNPECPVDG